MKRSRTVGLEHVSEGALVTTFTTTSLSDPNAVDLLAIAGEDGFLYEREGVGVAGRGEALRLQVDYSDRSLNEALSEVIAQLKGLDSGGTPIAFVAVPFGPSRPVLAVVPELIVRKSTLATGQSAATAVACDGVDIPSASSLPQPTQMRTPTSFVVSAKRSPKEWCDIVEEATRRIGRGELQKVVLAREVLVEADDQISQVATLGNLRRTFPSAYLYAIDGLVGASPELLIEREGSAVRSMPLAGTLPRSNDPVLDDRLRAALLHSDKDRDEHQYLARSIRDTLTPFCAELQMGSTPEVMSLSNVHHLATPVTGRLARDVDVLRLLSALHPTPAVGGVPAAAAISLIAELEELDRGYYAGAVGWVDAHGDGSFAIALRGAQIEGDRARVIAGNGIVAASDPAMELEETRWKLQVMLSALVRP